jgi:hypothetical protein
MLAFFFVYWRTNGNVQICYNVQATKVRVQGLYDKIPSGWKTLGLNVDNPTAITLYFV